MNSLLISCKESRIENNRSFYGCFNLGPFEAGKSLTVANALRRTLLSECTGIAIVSVMIENVHHEYSTLPGVRDSILDILLNLKEMVLKRTKNPYGIYKKKSIDSVYKGVGESFFKPVMGYLKVKGPGVIRAKDLRLPTFIQCVDPEQYIATLGDDGVLTMKFIIMEGQNYILGKATRDSALLKKRDELVSRLQNVISGNSSTLQAKQPFSPPRPLSKKKSATEVNFTKGGTFAFDSAAEKGSAESTKMNPQQRAKITQNEHFCSNATQLYLDAVFNPVTKVNYIIEGNENQLVEASTQKYSLVEDITSLMNSTEGLKEAFPFLAVGNTSSQNDNSLPRVQTKEFLEYVDNFSMMECNNLYNSLHPLKKESTTHNVILEIWTNGSLHPRDALSMAFENLSNVFLNLQQTEIMNPVFNDWAAYKKTLSSFNLRDASPGADSLQQREKMPYLTSTLIESPRTGTLYPPGGACGDLKMACGDLKMACGDLKMACGDLKMACGDLKMDGQRQSVNEQTLNSYRDLDISTLNISLRTYNALKRQGIANIGDLILKWNNIIEKKALKQILKSLKEINVLL